MIRLIIFLISSLFMLNAQSFSIQEMLGLDSPAELAIYSDTKLSSSKISDIMGMVESTFKEASGQSTDSNDPEVSYSGYLPNDLYAHYYSIAQELYVGGYARQGHFDTYLLNYKNLQNFIATAPLNEQEKVEYWWDKYEQLWLGYLNAVKNNPQVCAGPGVSSTSKKCCAGLVEMTQVITVGDSCKSQASSCSDNTQCCSGICNRDTDTSVGTCSPITSMPTGGVCNANSDCLSNLCHKPEVNSPGTCSTPKQCYKPVALGERCGDALTPLCQSGSCREVDSEVFGGECLLNSNSCEANSDCCSNSCSNNICVENKICSNCAEKNTTPKSDQQCCEGLYLDTTSGKCRTNIRPLDFRIPQTTLLEKILNNIFPIAHAAVTTDEAQESTIKRAKSECANLHTVNSSEYNTCMGMAENLVATSATERIGLTQAQTDKINAEDERCHSEYPTGSVSRQECINANEKNEQTLIRENKENGVDTGSGKTQDLIKTQKAPAVSEKTYSDPKSCEFRSFNDNWRSASNIEKNAEIFLRGFEVVYSGKGTQDFWQDGTKGNIWSRASNVARKFRTNRSKMIKNMAELDIKMACQCIAIWGPTNFSADKQEFFASDVCAEQRASVMAQMGSEVNDLKTGTSKDDSSNSEIASLNSINGEDKNTIDAAKLEEIDKGAAAISHEKLLIEWLGMRADAQMDRFTSNSELEKELIELSTFIEEKDFKEVWKGELKNKGRTLDRGSPEGDNVLLYRFGVKYLKGWVKLFVTVLAIAVAVFTMGTGLFVILGSGATGFLIASLIGAYGSKGAPGVGDLQIFKKSSYSFFKNWDGYERYYIGPLYDNKSPVDETKCRIYAKASACLRSGYEIKLEGMKYLTAYEGRSHFVIDTNKPLYATDSLYSMDTMPGLSLSWKDIINQTRNEGVQYLMSTKPGGGTKSKGGKSYKVKGTGYLKTDVFKMALDQKYFIPLRGKFVAKPFSQKNDLLKAAQKYALCKEMRQPNNPDCYLDDDTIQTEDYGFGNLFESTDEAKEFAIYTYEMHFLYSQISRDDYMGYPLLAQDAYFRAVAYNMKLVGSLAAQRAQNYGETFALYKEDWEKRVGEYNSLGEVAIGSGTRNIKYSKKFYETFGLLDFSGETNLDTFDAAQASSQSSGGFNKAELSALNAGRSSAVNTNKQISKINAYNKANEGNESSVKRNSTAALTMQKLNSPLAAFKMNKLGGGYGYSNVNDALSSISSDIDSLNNKMGSKYKTYGSNYGSQSGAASNFSFPSTNSGSYNTQGSVSNGFVDDSPSDSSQELSAEDLKRNRELLDALAKDQELEPKGDDSLWTILSKAYKRNYSRVLKRKNDLGEQKTIIEKKQLKTIEDKSEQIKLQELLEQ